MNCLEPDGVRGLAVASEFLLINGYVILPVSSRWGVLFEVMEDGTAFPTAKEAAQYASELPSLG